MYILKVVIAVTVIFFAVTIFAEDKKSTTASKLFEQHCSVCHGLNGGMNMKKRIAPPIAGVRAHYLDVHKNKESFVNAVTAWLKKPDASKSLMPGAIRHFNLMPPISIQDDDAKLIAEYIYDGDIEIPEGFKEHYEERHGNDNQNNNRQDLITLARHLKLPPQQLSQLALKPEQISQIKTLIVEKEVIMQPLREEVLEFNNQLNTLDSRSATYKSDIFALADINAKRVEQMVVESGEMRMKIEAVLNQQQYDKLISFRKQLNERRKQRLKQQMQIN
ncbi:hypothetical protein GCM10009133_04790 [Cocleimonas flava]|uniref:Cytochrome c n=1 Tax=Cocleimonas flava TaxID=634765 RepID=A0A4R1F520_9GAMM|nr:c-type cytochrome [Cocleimonas flava]TCJ86848.1 cytochrome c [Cocleimonas flava]